MNKKIKVTRETCEAARGRSGVVGRFTQIALAAMAKDTLTEEEKFAICFVAGVPMKYEMDAGGKKLQMTMAVGCDVEKVGGHWVVSTRPSPV